MFSGRDIAFVFSRFQLHKTPIVLFTDLADWWLKCMFEPKDTSTRRMVKCLRAETLFLYSLGSSSMRPQLFCSDIMFEQIFIESIVVRQFYHVKCHIQVNLRKYRFFQSYFQILTVSYNNLIVHM